jgi:hypothetical protein
MALGSGRSTAVVVTGLLVALLAAGVPAQAATKRKPTAASALKTLVKQTKALPRTATSRAKRNKLRLAAAHARQAGRRNPCAAVKDLKAFRRVLRGIKTKSGKRFAKLRRRLAALQPASMTASRALLADKRTKKCGGGVAPSSVTTTETKIIRSDASGMQLHVTLPDLNFVARTGGGKTWTQLTMPDTDSPQAPGKPGIPVASKAFGIPDGATLEVKPGSTTSYTVDGVDVFPAQPDPVDSDTPAPDFHGGRYTDAAFVVDKKAYGTKGLQPSDAAGGQVLGTSRDLVIGGLQIPAAQYDAANKKLKVLQSVDVTINFNGGDHLFNPVLGSPWEDAARRFAGSLLNADLIRRLNIRWPPVRCGEQMLVITHPDTLAAANQFATGKRAQGMRVTVVQTGVPPAGIGTTPTEIQSFIRDRLTQLLCIHPSYITILGDDDLVPTFPGINGIPSDLQYSMKNDADELPDVAVGRIIGNDQTAVGNAVTKILGYETTPPTGPMLTHATIAAEFQDDDSDGTENRTFVLFAETVRNGLVGRGVTVDRIYGESPVANPQRLNDGTALPAALLKPTFAWNGTGAEVSTAWNDGRFMVIHRDHGWSDGWGIPSYGTADAQALTNGSKLPVVLSVNCSSGAYDYDETSFAGESLVNPNGGAVGVFGDTRDSPTWHNTQIALGFVDGLLPSVLPSEGPANKQRMGDALINGKLRLAGLAPPAGDGNTRNELYLWHYFGDPSMQMWGGGNVFVIDVNAIKGIFLRQIPDPPPGDPPPYWVHVTLPPELNGQTISLLRNGDVIGKANIADGAADIPASFGDGSPKPGELTMAVEPDGGPAVSAGVDGVPQPEPQPADTTLTQTCPDTDPNNPMPSGGNATVSGTLSPAFAGATIRVKWTRPDDTSFEHTVTTDADGKWSDTIVPQLEHQNAPLTGTWHVESHYDGDSTHKPSSAGPCAVYVFDNS